MFERGRAGVLAGEPRAGVPLNVERGGTLTVDRAVVRDLDVRRIARHDEKRDLAVQPGRHDPVIRLRAVLHDRLRPVSVELLAFGLLAVVSTANRS